MECTRLFLVHCQGSRDLLRAGQSKQFDLTQYAGKKVQLRFRYVTDWGYNDPGIFVDNVKVTADGATVLEDGGEGATSVFTQRDSINMMVTHTVIIIIY